VATGTRAQHPIPSSIWGAALVAANCRAVRPKGRTYPVRWELRPGCLCFAARQEVEVQPLGIHLCPGEILEVRWEPNQTSYSLTVRRPL
jgi:hypothetical protein